MIRLTSKSTKSQTITEAVRQILVDRSLPSAGEIPSKERQVFSRNEVVRDGG
jgi:hypothetical protein